MVLAVPLAPPQQLELGLAQQTPIASVVPLQPVHQVAIAEVLVQLGWTSASSVHQVKSVLTTPAASFRVQQGAIVLAVPSVMRTLIQRYTSAQLAIIAQQAVPYHASAFQVHLMLPLALPRVHCALKAHIAPLQDSRLLCLAPPIENVRQLAPSNHECVLLVKVPMEREHAQHAQLVNTVGQSQARTVLPLMPVTLSMFASLVQQARLHILVICARFSRLGVTFWLTMVLLIQVSEQKLPAVMCRAWQEHIAPASTAQLACLAQLAATVAKTA
jgi:hypothetical protein